MSYKVMCDLCGKPIVQGTMYRRFKIKESTFCSWDGWSWTVIDAHDECIQTILNAFKNIKTESPIGGTSMQGE